MFQPRPSTRIAASRIRSALTGAGLAAALAVAVPAIATSTAAAAPYSVDLCTSSGGPTPTDDRFVTGENADLYDDCSLGAAPNPTFGAAYFGDTLDTAHGGLRIEVPALAPNVTITDIAGTAQLLGKHGPGSGDLSLTSRDGVTRLKYLQDIEQAETSNYAPIPFDVRNVGARGVYLRAQCSLRCTFWNDPSLTLSGLKIKLDDPLAPRATFESTGLLSPGNKAGVQVLTFNAIDDDSGVQFVNVTAATQSFRAATSTCDFRGALACVRAHHLSVPIDTDRIPAGAGRTITITVTDAAGNAKAIQSPPFTVGPPTQPGPTTPPPSTPPVETTEPEQPILPGPGDTPVTTAPEQLAPPTPPADAPASREAVPGLPATRLPGAPNGLTPGKVVVGPLPKSKAVSTLTRDYGKPVVLAGQLLHDGRPLAGVSVDILRTHAGAGAQPTRVATVVTDAQGRYTYTAKPTASASFTAAYPEHVGAGDYSATRTVTVRVVAGVSLRTHVKATARGVKVRFSGAVQIDPFPADGARVAIQVRSAYGWQDVAFLSTRAGGTFRWSHAFRTAGSFRFRAKVLRQRDLGADPGASAPIGVRVR